MNKKSKILSLLLCLIMLLSCLAVIPAAADEATDVTQDGENTDQEDAAAGEETVVDTFYTDLEGKINSETYPASKYPWALFTSKDGGETYSFYGAYPILLHHNESVATSKTAGKYPDALWAARFCASASQSVLILLRDDYTWRGKADAVESTVVTTASYLNNGLLIWDEEAGDWATEDVTTTVTNSDGTTTTYYHYTHVYDTGNNNFGLLVGDLTVDLGGHTLDLNSTSTILFSMQNKTTNQTATTITLKNGTVENSSATIFRSFYSKAVTDTVTRRNIDFKMEDLVYKASFGATNAVIQRYETAANSGKIQIDTNVNIINSVIDLSEAQASCKLFQNQSVSGYLNAFISGGEIITDAIKQDSMDYSALASFQSSIDGYTAYTYEDEDGNVFTDAINFDEENATNVIGMEKIEGYDGGYIPTNYRDAEKWPFVLLKKSTSATTYSFLSAHTVYMSNENEQLRYDKNDKKIYIGALHGARLAASSTQDVVIYLRSDYKIRTKETAVEETVYYTKTRLDNYARLWDATIDADNDGIAEGGWATEDVTVTYKGTTCYMYTHVYDTALDNFGNLTGNLIFDLNGNTFDFTSSPSALFPLQNKTRTSTKTCIEVKNGSLTNLSKDIFEVTVGGGSGTVVDSSNTSKTREMIFSMTNVDIKINSTGAQILSRSGTEAYVISGVTYYRVIPNVTLTMENCTIDLTALETSAYTMFSNTATSCIYGDWDAESGAATTLSSATNYGTMTVSVNGCTILSKNLPTTASADYSDISGLVVRRDEDGYTDSVSVQQTEILGYIVTEYGKISYDYRDSSVYPFAIFKKGDTSYTFLSVLKYYSTNDSNGESVLSYLFTQNGQADVKLQDIVVLLRTDYQKISSEGDYHNFAYHTWNSLTIDLGGNTLSLGGVSLIPLNLKKNTTRTEASTITVKNGTLDSTATVVRISQGAANGHKLDYGVNINITDVKFDSTNSTINVVKTNDSVPGLIADYFTRTGSPYPINIIFSGCTVAEGKSIAWDTKTYSSPYLGISITCEHEDGESSCEFCDAGEKVMIDGYNVTLGELLAMNFYVSNLHDVDTIKLTVANEETIIKLADLESESDGIYKITAKVSSIETRSAIKIEFLDANGEAINIMTSTVNGVSSYTTSVYAYAQTLAVCTAEDQKNVKAAAQALINYAAYAEKYFAAKNGNEFDIEDEFTFASALSTEKIDTTLPSGNTNALGVACLVLDSATKIKIELLENTYEGGFDNNGKENIAIVGGYIEISGIDAKNLDTNYTFTVDGAQISVSAVGVAAMVVNDTNGADGISIYDADFVNLMKALYEYSTACKALV